MYGGIEDLRPAGSKDYRGGGIVDINTCPEYWKESGR